MADRERPKPWYSDTFKLLAVFATGFTILNFGALILFWNWASAVRNIDSLSVSLTVLEIFLAVIAVSGFFLIRSAAVRRAEEEARETAEKVAEETAKREIREIAPSMVRRQMLEKSFFDQIYGSVYTTDSEQEIMQALDDGNDDAG